MTVHESMNIARKPQTRSHSFASAMLPSLSGWSAVMMTIFPDLSISMRAICTPAAVTALTALVTSCCRNVEGARAMVSTREAFSLAGNPVSGPRLSWRSKPCWESLPGAREPQPLCQKGQKGRKGAHRHDRHPFLTFPTFLALGPQKKVAG
jgi:hypothetical protein